MPRVLIVDDEEAIVWGLSKLVRDMGHSVDAVSSAEEGVRRAAEQCPDLVLLDVRLPGIDGISAIEQFRRHVAEAPIIVMTAFGALDTAVKAIRSGAFEYLLKPFDLQEVRSVIERSLCRGEGSPEKAPVQPDNGMVGQSPVMQALYKKIALVAASDANVLLQGESGVGKELAARAIHRYSGRARSPFVAVNAAALTPSLAESELFGHVSGAFTGAQGTRDGLLAQADGGTLFLDEIADIPLPLQIKLLRAIEQQEVLPVGADAPVTTSFRVIAATHRDLKRCIQEGGFRHDLYYRICAFEIGLPPLRERADDIPQLAAFFAERITSRVELSAEAVAELCARPWYGNVRELRNAIEHAVVLARSGVISPEHLPASQPRFEPVSPHCLSPLAALEECATRRTKELLDDPASDGAVYEQFLREVERPLLESTLERFGNEYAPAARALGVHRTTLKRKVKQLGDTNTSRQPDGA